MKSTNQIFPRRPRPARPGVLIGALLLLTVIFYFDFPFLYSTRSMPGEEQLRLGEHLRATGVLSLNDQPACFRPPGYPVFAATVLWTRDHLALLLSDERVVMLANGLLLSLGTLLLFWSAVRRQTVTGAAAFAAVFAFHPAVLIIATNVSYPMLDMVLIISATVTLAIALRATQHRTFWTLLAGAIWGLATLVRPVSLILPPFVLLLAHWENGPRSWGRTLRFSGLFTLAMILALAPVAWRNYRVSGRLIAINAQAGFSFWGTSLQQMQPATDYPIWREFWDGQGMAIFTRVTGRPDYSLDALYAFALPLNDAFAREARQNITTHPGIYLRNVARNLLRYNLDTSDWWIDRYYIDNPDLAPARRGKVNFPAVFTGILTALALFGLVQGIVRDESLARTLLVIYAMFCLATCIGFPAARYNYARLPLILLALPLLIPEGNRLMLRWPRDAGRDRAAPPPSFSVDSNALFALIIATGAAIASFLVL